VSQERSDSDHQLLQDIVEIYLGKNNSGELHPSGSETFFLRRVFRSHAPSFKRSCR